LKEISWVWVWVPYSRVFVLLLSWDVAAMAVTVGWVPGEGCSNS